MKPATPQGAVDAIYAEVRRLRSDRRRLVEALLAFVERGAKVSAFEASYLPWVGELMTARAILAEIEP